MKRTTCEILIGSAALAALCGSLLTAGCAVVEETPQTQTTYRSSSYRGQVSPATLRDLDARYPEGFYREAGKAVPEGERLSIGIAAFEGPGPLAPLARQVTDVFSTTFVKSGLFKVVEREKIDRIAAEIELGQSGLVDPAQAREVGRMTGMQLLLSGNISDSGGNRRIDVKVVDVNTGEAVLAEMLDGVIDADRAGFLARLVAKGLAERYYGGE